MGKLLIHRRSDTLTAVEPTTVYVSKFVVFQGDGALIWVGQRHWVGSNGLLDSPLSRRLRQLFQFIRLGPRGHEIAVTLQVRILAQLFLAFVAPVMPASSCQQKIHRGY